MGKSESPAGMSRSNSSPGWNQSSFPRLQSCREGCKGCKRENCGKCKCCLDMVMFGGTGGRKRRCVERRCENMYPTTPRPGQKNTQNSPTLKKAGSAPALKGKAPTTSKSIHDKKTENSAQKSSLPSKNEAVDENKAQAGRKEIPKGIVVHTGAESKKRPNISLEISKTPQPSPKTKVQGSNTPTFCKVKSVNRTILSSPTLKVESPLKNSQTQDVNSMPQRFSPRIKSVAQTTPGTSPKTKQSMDLVNDRNSDASQHLNLQTKQLYGSTRSKAGDPERRKSTEIGKSEERHASENTTSADTGEEALAFPKCYGSTSSEQATTVAAKKNIELPSLKLDSMTKSELKEFIPKLLKLVTGKEEVFYSRRSAKPEWWPEDVAWVASRTAWYNEKYWTDNLKAIVKSCYKHVGREDLLQGFVTDSNINSRSSSILGSEDIQSEDSVKTGSYPPSPVKIRMFPQGLFLPFSAEIYICFFCEKEFLSKETMRSHQKGCKERPPDLQKFSTEVDPCGAIQAITPPAMSPKKNINRVWSKLSLDKFTGQLGLVPKLTAAKLREQRRSVEEINCEILDDIEPVSPVTPKTPKSLISQLSREDSGHVSRKRLSYSMSVESHKDSAEVVSESGSDTESDAGKEQKHVNEVNLLDIPISSLLGQRIKNYVRADTPVSIVEDTSHFCRTPVKNTFLEKLRKKPLAYPMLYRPRRIANLHKQNHIYRFKKSEVKEFMCKINTGLNSASLEKMRSMKKFSIRVRRLSRKRLLNWMSRRTLDKQLRGVFKGLKYNPYSELDDNGCEFPSGPTLLIKNIDKLLGLKKRTSQESSNVSLSLSNFISEEMEAEVSKQKLTLYRSLLYEMSVLKPAVVMEDISGKVEYSERGLFGKNQNRLVKHIDTVEKEVKPRSIFRDMCRKSREERLIAEVEERERKEEYKTLKALLNAPKGQGIKLVVHNVPVKTPEFRVIGAKHVKRSPNDDAISIMSGSSEGESLHSNCCTGCNDKKHRLVSPLVTELDKPIQGQSVSTIIQPLHVDVGADSAPKIDEYGIPSPVSLSSESPFPPTPSKSSCGIPDDLGKDIDPIELSPLLKRETRSTRSSGLLSLSSKSSMCSPKDFATKSVTSSPHLPVNLKRIQSEGMKTRSCSGTPSGSPVKRSTRSGGSAPNSPSVSPRHNKFILDVTQVSRQLEIPNLLPSSEVRFNLRSGVKPEEIGDKVEVGKCDSTKKAMCSANTDSGCSSNDKTVINTNNETGNPSAGDNPLTSLKRRLSVFTDDDPPPKKFRKSSDRLIARQQV